MEIHGWPVMFLRDMAQDNIEFMSEMVHCVLLIHLSLFLLLQVNYFKKIELWLLSCYCYLHWIIFLVLSATAKTTQQRLCRGQNGAIQITAAGGNGGNMYSVCCLLILFYFCLLIITNRLMELIMLLVVQLAICQRVWLKVILYVFLY